MRRLLLSLVMLLLWGVMPAYTQDIAPPLVAYFNGELYRFDDASFSLVDYDACQPDEEIVGPAVPSPDGTHFVLMTLPRALQEAIETIGSAGGGPLPTHLWLCDTRTDTLRRILEVPGGDAPFEGEFPDLPLIISMPAWSPDSSKLAWSSILFPEGTTRITVFDVDGEPGFAFPIELPEDPFGVPVPPTVNWISTEQLIFDSFGFSEGFEQEEYVNIVDVNAPQDITTTLLDRSGETDDFIIDRVLLGGESPAYALRFFEQGWLRADLFTGERTPLNGLPELYNPQAPDGARLWLDIDTDFFYNWQTPDRSVTIPTTPPSRVAIAPDGENIAWADSSLKMAISATQEVAVVSNSEGFADDAGAWLIWGGEAYRLRPGAALQAASLPTCEGAQQSRLRVGDTARVVQPTIPNNVRLEPSTSATLIGQVPGGGSFTVLDGPVCADGYAWYQLQLGDLLGWTAEGSSDTYFLEPVE